MLLKSCCFFQLLKEIGKIYRTQKLEFEFDAISVFEQFLDQTDVKNKFTGESKLRFQFILSTS